MRALIWFVKSSLKALLFSISALRSSISRFLLSDSCEPVSFLFLRSSKSFKAFASLSLKRESLSLAAVIFSVREAFRTLMSESLSLSLLMLPSILFLSASSCFVFSSISLSFKWTAFNFSSKVLCSSSICASFFFISASSFTISSYAFVSSAF